MWIESTHHTTVRQHIISPPGYQSPTLGDSIPVPGPQEAQCVTPQPGVTTSKLSRVPRLFALIEKPITELGFHNGGGTTDFIKMKSWSARLQRKRDK